MSCVLRLALAFSLSSTLACTGTIDSGQSDSVPTEGGAVGGGEVPPGSGPGTPSDGPRLGPGFEGTFEGPIVSAPAPSTRFSRLTHEQYENTIRDLFRLEASPDLASSFVAEPLRSAFDNNGSVLDVSSEQQQDYQRAAETMAVRLVSETNLFEELVPASAGTDQERARAYIQDFGLRAFRRPLTDAEVEAFLTLFDQGSQLVNRGSAFEDGIELVTMTMLQSPHFLYRSELSSDASSGVVLLSDYEVASKLSYALTNSMPDDELFAAAARAELTSRQAVVDHAVRLLSTDSGRATVLDFHDQLLHMRDFEQISKDESQNPAFGAGVVEDLKLEGLNFVQSVVFDGRQSLFELLTAPYTFANTRIAEIYGVAAPGSSDTAFVRVDLDASQRAGLLTQAGFLATHAEGTTPNTIMRGVNISHNILCSALPPPPDMVPALPELQPGMTNRERVEELTSAPACAGCHGMFINPLGFALESLDGVASFRTTENSKPINTLTQFTLDDQAVTFDGPVEMMHAIAGSKQAHDCYANHWIEYLYGRTVNLQALEDLDLVDQAGWLSKSHGAVLDVVVNLVGTEAFMTRAQ